MLEYDNSAFYYFSLTLLTIYLLPGYYFLFLELYLAFLQPPSGSDGTAPRTKLEQAKAAKVREKVHGLKRLKRWQFLTNLICLAFSTLLFIYLINLVIRNGAVSTFDPFHILGLQPGATVTEIKRAYRILSLKYHPDKNPGNKVAEEMFMKVAKANEALTDPISKANFEKYGNPDGKQSLEVSIGLPTFILENPKVVLVLYLISMVVFIPVAVGLWYANSKQFGEKNILYESYTAFYQLLTEQHRVKMMPEVVAASAEFRKINTPRPSDAEPLVALKNKMKGDKLVHKPKFEHPQILKGNLLLHAHCLRMVGDLTPEFRADLDAMLMRAPELIEGVIEIAQQRRWLQTTIAAIRFEQCVVQALWYTDSSLMQLPHFTEETAKHVAKGSKVQARTLGEYLRIEDDAKKGLSRMSEEEKAEVLATCRILPQLEVTTEFYVEEEEPEFYEEGEAPVEVPEDAIRGDTIYENDLVTLRVTLTRLNVPEGGVAPLVHAPLFPAPLKEGWWLILTDRPADKKADGEATIHAIEKVTDQSRVVKHELRFMAPAREGDYMMELRVLSDSYMGLDEELELKFTVRPASELPVYAPHPEDVELDNEPTLFEQVMTADLEDSSDEEGDDEPAAANAAPAASDLKRSAVKAMASPINLDEDSEEED